MPRAWSTPKSTGQRITATEFNKLNSQPILCDGDTTLTADCEVTLDFDLTLTGAGGKFKPEGGSTEFSTFPGMASQSVTEHVAPVGPAFSATEYETGAGFLRQIDASKTLIYNVFLPLGAVVTAVRVPVKKPAAASFPGTLAAIGFSYVTLSTGVATLVGSANDPSGSEAAYETHHLIELTGLSHTVTSGRAYYVTVIGDDNSSGSVDGLQVYTPYFSLTLNNITSI